MNTIGKIIISAILMSCFQLSAWSQEHVYKSGDCWTGIDGVNNWYADSLNLIQQPSQLPAFLSDYLIDWKLRYRLRGCMKEPYQMVSFRNVVLSRVYREDVLEWIISSRNADYDKLYIPKELDASIKNKSYHNGDFPDLPYMKYSWRDLAKMRLDDLRKQKKAINRN